MLKLIDSPGSQCCCLSTHNRPLCIPRNIVYTMESSPAPKVHSHVPLSEMRTFFLLQHKSNFFFTLYVGYKFPIPIGHLFAFEQWLKLSHVHYIVKSSLASRVDILFSLIVRSLVCINIFNMISILLFFCFITILHHGIMGNLWNGLTIVKIANVYFNIIGFIIYAF